MVATTPPISCGGAKTVSSPAPARSLPEKTELWAKTTESGRLWQLRLLRWLSLYAPDILLDKLLWLIALGFSLNKRRTATMGSILYLRRIFGREPNWLERQRHACEFAHVVRDRVRFLSGGTDSFEIKASGQERIAELCCSGRGAVLLGAHFGSFEALRAFDRHLPGLVVRYLMFPDHAPHTTALLRELNPQVAERVISLKNGQHAMLEVYEALNRGEFVAFLGDRLPSPTIRSKLSLPFLGSAIDLPASPYIAALAAKVPLIICTAPRLGKNRYAIGFEEIYDGRPVARCERSEKAGEMARRFTLHLEEMCRRYPYNWFNFFDIWQR